jgi:leucyl aminopeptidase (aminopeptidase T)
MCNVRPGENVLIYTDSYVDRTMADAIAQAAHVAQGVVSLVEFDTRPRPDLEPPRPVAEAMKASDVIIELAWMYLIHTQALRHALDHGARYACLTMLTPDIMKRCIGPVDYYDKVLRLGQAVVSLLKKASDMRITTPAGTDLACNVQGRLIDDAAKRIFGPGEQSYPGGQVSWYPRPETIQGTMVFDGSMWPPEGIGLIRTPIKLKIESGVVTRVEGGREAEILNKWFQSWGNRHIYELAHLSYGLNPGARMTGNILEDERVFGCVEVGIGAQPPKLGIFEVPVAEAAKGHTDATMLNPTVVLDGEVIEKDGVFCHPNLVAITNTF